MSLRSLLQPPDDHLRALTGLRGVAAGWVLLYHLWQFAGGPRLALGPLDLTPLAACGYFGVDLFFVLSGYLLGRPFVAARIAGRPMPSLARFWQRRCRRVLPAYWTQLGLLLVIALLAGRALPLSAGALAGHATLTFNLVGNDSPVNPVYWSLPVEWDFYLLLPLLAFGFSRGGRWPWLLPLALAAALLFRYLCGWALLQYGADGVGMYRWVLQLPARIDQFAFGMGAAWLSLRGAGPALRRALALGGVLLVLLEAWLTAPRGDYLSQADLPWVYWHFSAIGLAFAAIVAAVALHQRALVRLLSGPLLGLLGVVSYSLYLWHYPLLSWLRPLAATLPAAVLWAVLAPIGALLLACISYLLVERPFLLSGPGRAAVPAATAP